MIPISTLAYDKVQFFTVKVEGRQLSEFRDFHSRMQEHETLKVSWEMLNGSLYAMKNRFGAEMFYFDNDALTKPLPYCCYIEITEGRNAVRLYCLRLSESVVILLNGDQRTSANIRNCPICFPHFELAFKAEQAIGKGLEEGTLWTDDQSKTLHMREDFKILL